MKKLFILVLASLEIPKLLADGIPEPGVIFFGSVVNSAESNVRLTFGSLSWTVTQLGMQPQTFNTVLTNFPGGLSYRLRVPYESLAGASAAGPVALILNSTPAQYNNAGILVLVGGTNRVANVIGPSQVAYNIGVASRAQAKRVDLSINAPGVRPGGPPNLPSVAGLQNGLSGTGQSGIQDWPFQFTRIEPRAEGGVMLHWQGAPANREYLLLRAQSVGSESEQYEVVRVFPASPSTVDSFHDTNTVNTSAYFYKLVLR